MTQTLSRRMSVIRHSGFDIRRSALTLIEMLIGMAITLLMMAAVVNLFANIGSGVRVRQATIEMSAELRNVRTMLYNDLTHATCRAVPWQRPDEDPGYIEIVEGRFSDRNPSRLLDGDPSNGEIEYGISQLPGSQTTPSNQTTDGTGLGDYDDIIALTVRRDDAPFKGNVYEWDPVRNTWITTTIESSVAEVIWFAVENRNANSTEELGIRNIYRRELLVTPWLPSREVRPDENGDPLVFLRMLPPYTPQTISYVDANGNQATTTVEARSDNDVYQNCDCSFRREGNLRIANSLGDLTKRENRFAHYSILLPDASGTPVFLRGFPHQFPFDVNNQLNPLEAGVPNSSLQPFGDPRAGEDFVIGNALAFDIQVFDPGAPLFEYPPNSGFIIEPVTNSSTDTMYVDAISTGNLVGFGAYVDLGWDNSYDYDPNMFPGSPRPDFQEKRLLGYHPKNPAVLRTTPAVYDTWSLHYEYDGWDQDDTSGNDNLNDLDPNTGLIDEGTNGIDDDGLRGVDDVGGLRLINGNPVYFPGERETSPPYDVELRAVKVKVRIYEPDTRQVREVSVKASFVPQ